MEAIVHKHFDKPMLPFEIAADNSSIEHYYGSLKVDFANEFIGGGSLIG